MIEVKINTKKGTCEIIDNAEGTPGASRQITKFRQYCFPILEEEVKKDKTLKTTNVNNIRFNQFGFNLCEGKATVNDDIYLAWDIIKNSNNE